jgi:hypothetical protein
MELVEAKANQRVAEISLLDNRMYSSGDYHYREGRVVAVTQQILNPFLKSPFSFWFYRRHGDGPSSLNRSPLIMHERCAAQNLWQLKS